MMKNDFSISSHENGHRFYTKGITFAIGRFDLIRFYYVTYGLLVSSTTKKSVLFCIEVEKASLYSRLVVA